MKIRSAVPEKGCFVFFDGWKKNKKTEKKTEKTSVKHISIRLIYRCVNKLLVHLQLSLTIYYAKQRLS